MESSALALSGLALSFYEACDAKEKIHFSAASLRAQLHLTLFLHLRPQPLWPPAPYGANTQPIMANEGSMEALDLLCRRMSPARRSHDDMAAGIAVDLGAMMMHHHHHHRLHILTVETVLWSK